ncbi:MAG: hypothetical protein RH917_05100 [Lacipirellulaceae bacterium]
MRRTKRQTATAIALTAMYLVVGLGGQSLHYLVDSTASASTDSVAEEAHHQGYHHFHGPDFHVHYHGPVKSVRTASSTSTKTDNKREKNSGADYDEPGEQHEPHACPLLAVLSDLEQSQVGLIGWFLEDTSSTQIASETESFAHRESTRLHQPRGPPSFPLV